MLNKFKDNFGSLSKQLAHKYASCVVYSIPSILMPNIHEVVVENGQIFTF